jgi:hypothetical protein
MSIQTNVYGVHDEEVGTLVLTLSDPVAEVSEVRFYVTDGSGVRSGPFEADRQSPDLPPGIYEKDVQLDIANETMIEAELLLGNGSIQNIGSESFPRTSGILVTLKQEDVTERGASIEIGTGLRLTRSVDLRRPRLEASDIMLSLLNFRDAERTSTGVVYRWARGSSVAEIHVYDMVYTQPVPADPWSSHGAPTAILRTNDEYSAAIPPVGSVRYLQFEPRDARMSAGPVQRAILTGLPEAKPTLEQIRQLSGSAANKADLAVVVTDPRNRGGTLYAWLNRLSPESADPGAAADGVLLLGAPGMVTSGNVWALTGGGTAQLFNEITLHAGRGKRIYLEYVTTDGVSTGKVNVELIGGAVAIDPDTGEITDGSIDIAKFAEGIEPVTIHEGADLPMVKSTSAILWNGTLYRWDGQAYSSAVPAADITGQIDTSQIADAAVSAEKLGTGAVQTANLAIAAVTAEILAASAVNSTHIRDGAIDTPKLAAGAVTTGNLATGAVTANEIAADAIQAASVAAGAITTAKLDAGAVTAAKIGALAITSDKLAANAVVAGKLAAGSVTAGTIDANAVTAGTIAAGAVSTNELDAGAVTAEKIAVGAVTADRISVDRLSALNEDVGQVTAGYLRNVAGNAGISLSVGPPSGWTRYIDLSGAGEYFLHTQDVRIDHGGNATFSGELMAASGSFAGDLAAQDVRLSSGGTLVLEPAIGFLKGSVEWWDDAEVKFAEISAGYGGFGQGLQLATVGAVRDIMLYPDGHLRLAVLAGTPSANETAIEVFVGGNGAYSGVRRVKVDGNGLLSVA